MRKLLVVFFCIFSLNVFAQKIEWAVPPIADSVTEDNVNKRDFAFYSSGKKGYILNMKIDVPAQYDEVIPENYNSEYYYIKNKKKWGIYNRTSEMELLECLYDTIVKADYPFPLYKVFKGNLFAYYNAFENKWETSFALNNILPIINKEKYFESNLTNSYNLVSEAESIKEKANYRIVDLNVENEKVYNALKKLFPQKNVGIESKITEDLYTVFIEKYPYDLFQFSTNRIVLESLRFKPILRDNLLICYKTKETIILQVPSLKILATFDNRVQMPDFTNHLLEKHNKKYIIAEKGGKRGLFSENYKLLIPFEFDSLEWQWNVDLVYCYQKKRAKLFNLQTLKFIQQKFETIYANSNNSPIILIKKSQYYRYSLNTDKIIKLPFKKIYKWPIEDSILLVFDQNNLLQLYNINQDSFKSKQYKQLYFTHEEETNKHLAKYGRKVEANTNKRIHKVIIFEENLKYGVLDRTGKTLFEAKYDTIFGFCESRRSDGNIYEKEFLLLKSGEHLTLYDLWKSKTILDSITAISAEVSENGVYWYRRKSKYGLLSIHKDIFLESKFDTFYEKKHVYIFAIQNKYKVFFPRENSKRYNYSDSLDKYTYSYLAEMPNLLFVSQNNGKYGIVSAFGDNSIDCKYDTIYCHTYSIYGGEKNYLTIVCKNKKLGFYLNEKICSETSFDNFMIGRNGYLWAKYNGKWGILGKNQ